MATANWAKANELQVRFPHTYTAMEHLIMAMADAHNNQGKKTFFGNDKGLKSHIKFEEKLKNTLLAMTMDGLVARHASATDFREALLTVLAAWFEIFPNWPDAYAYANTMLISNKRDACQLISVLIGVKA